jgi:hypothetical protein
MKDYWTDKPSWARYRARDHSGEVYWHENLPLPVGSTGIPGKERNVWRSNGRMAFAAFEIDVAVPWNDTLEKRP